MGGYLSQPAPQPAPPDDDDDDDDALDGDPAEGPEHLGPAHPAAWTPEPPARPWGEPPPPPPSPRRRRGLRRRGAAPGHRLQARCLLLGAQRKPAPGDGGARMLCTSVVLRLASAKGRLLLRLALQHTVTCLWASLCVCLPGPGVKEALARLLQEEPGPRDAGDAGAGEPGAQPAARTPRGEPGGAPDGSPRRPKSAFRRLTVRGVLSSFEPRPGPLRRDAGARGPHGEAGPDPCARAGTVSGPRNAIASSYSSTRGLPELWLCLERDVASRGPASPVPEEPPRASSPPRPPAPAAPPPRPPPVEAPGRPEEPRSSPPDDGRPRRRRTCLLRAPWREDPLHLPLPPLLGYSVTCEDLDAERRDSVRMINRILEG